MPLCADDVLDACGCKKILVVEEGCRSGGIGEAIAAAAARRGRGECVRVSAIDGFLTHADVPQLEKLCRLDAESVAADIASFAAEGITE